MCGECVCVCVCVCVRLRESVLVCKLGAKAALLSGLCGTVKLTESKGCGMNTPQLTFGKISGLVRELLHREILHLNLLNQPSRQHVWNVLLSDMQDSEIGEPGVRRELHVYVHLESDKVSTELRP